MKASSAVLSIAARIYWHGYPTGWVALPESSSRLWILLQQLNSRDVKEHWDSEHAMTTRWESLVGSTDIFALKLAFSDDPDKGQGIDPETGSSWGSFQIWVQGRNLCAHREEGVSIDSVHWYLLPLLEWFALNWDPLFHEERLPVKNAGSTAWESLRNTRFPPRAIEDDESKASEWEGAWQAWWFRHAILSAREGGLFPDIVFRRLRDRIELSWGPTEIAGMPTHYRFAVSERGAACLPPSSVAEPLHDVLSQAGKYLLKVMPNSKRIEDLSCVLRNLKVDGSSSEEACERRLAWLAGLGTNEQGMRAGWRRATESLSDVDKGHHQAWLKPKETPLALTGSCHAALLYGSLAPEVTTTDVQELARAVLDLYDPQSESDEIHVINHATPIEESTSHPWDQGYDLAEEVHERIENDFCENGFVDVEEIIKAHGVHIGNLTLSDTHVRGVAIAGPQHKPGMFVNECYAPNADEAGRRFTLAHEFCHLLFDQDQGQALAVASGPWAPRAIEQRANAFAAMLLMPTFLLKQMLSGLTVPITMKGDVDDLAKHLLVGRLPLLHHLANLGFMDYEDRIRLEGELPPFA